MNINIRNMGLFQNEIQIVENPENNKPDKVKLESLNGYDAIREKLDDNNNTWTVKQTMANEKSKTKVSIGL